MIIGFLSFILGVYMENDYFKMKLRNTDIKTEFLAGLTTFLAMSYILGVNPTMLSEGGMPATAIFFSSALAAGIACIVMGLISNYPIGLAPGMGLNALLTYTVIISMGYSWQAGLAAIFIASILFFLITISGLRESILHAIPNDLKLAIGAGIGFFIAVVGLKNSGIVVANQANIIALGNLTGAVPLLALIGIAITLILYVRKIPAAVFVGLIITSIIGVIFTLLGFGANTPTLMPVVPHQVVSVDFDYSLVGGFLSGFGELFSSQVINIIMVIFSFLLVNFFDATGTLVGLGNQAGFSKDENGELEGIDKAFIGDSVGGLIGTVLGSSPVTAYVESATGIGLGGRTGLTAIFTGIFFLIAMFFAPAILSLFTSPVTTSCLVVVGILMMAQLKDIDWSNLVTISSTFATILMMVLTSSITLGIAFGFVTYAVTSIASGKAKELHWSVWILAIIFVFYLFFGL